MDLGNLDNASKTDDQETRQEEFDPLVKVRWPRAPRSLTASGLYAVGQR